MIFMSRGLDDDEKELEKRLANTGMKKNTAKALVYIASNEGTKSRDIEADLRLRQPEVSIATKELRQKGWVTTEKQKKEGKGRPIHLYYLDEPFKEIIQEIEKDQRAKIEKIEKNLEKIKELVEKV